MLDKNSKYFFLINFSLQFIPIAGLIFYQCLLTSSTMLYCGYLYVPGKGKAKLTVAHVAGGNVEIIQPLTVTDTHVIINIQHLSPFGLILPWTRSPIRAQVLLFYKRMTEHRKSKLRIHLLPANVPVKEVIYFTPYFLFYTFFLYIYMNANLSAFFFSF